MVELASNSVAITKVGMPPARNPQRNMLNYKTDMKGKRIYNDRLQTEEAEEKTNKDYHAVDNDLVVVVDLLN